MKVLLATAADAGGGVHRRDPRAARPSSSSSSTARRSTTPSSPTSTSCSAGRCRPGCRRGCRASAGSARSPPASRSCSRPSSRRTCASRASSIAEQAAGIAQFVVAMALRHARGSSATKRSSGSATGRASRCRSRAHRVGVLGTGAMGGEIARWLERCGLLVRGWNRRAPMSFEALLAASDIVVCALPLTSATEGILDARAFAAMPRGAYVVNVARGAHVVEPDLIAAVRSGHLARRGARRAAPRAAAGRRSALVGARASRSRRTSRRSRRSTPSPSSSSPRARALAARRGAAQRDRSSARLLSAGSADSVTPRAAGSRSACGRSHGPGCAASRRRGGCRARRRDRAARRARACDRTTPGRRRATPSTATMMSCGCRPAASAGLSGERRTTCTWPAISTQLRPSQARLLLCELPCVRSSGRIGLSRSTGTNMLPRIAGPSPPAALPTTSEPTPTSSPAALKRPAPLWSVRAGAVKRASSM